jgi:hypothetical protein
METTGSRGDTEEKKDNKNGKADDGDGKIERKREGADSNISLLKIFLPQTCVLFSGIRKEELPIRRCKGSDTNGDAVTQDEVLMFATMSP